MAIVLKMNRDADSFVEDVRDLVEDYDGVFTGDNKKGEIKLQYKSWRIEGNYRIEGEDCHIEVTKKPLLVPESLIKKALEEILASCD